MFNLYRWAYKYNLHHSEAGVGYIYYTNDYFNKENIVNPATTQLYTKLEIKNIRESADKNNSNYMFDVPDNAIIGLNVIDTNKIYWYDNLNARIITSSASPLKLDKNTGNVSDMSGNLVARPM